MNAESGYALRQFHPVYRLLRLLAVSSKIQRRETVLQASVTSAMPISAHGRVVSVAPRFLMSTASLVDSPAMDERGAYVFA